MSFRDDLEILSASVTAELPCCLAFVAETWGSAPRAVGSVLAVFSDGSFRGSVSGGCIETDIITDSVDLLARNDKTIIRKNFGISDENAWEAGLACGGKMQVLLVPLLGDIRKILINALVEAMSDKRSALLAVMVGENRVALWVDEKLYGGDMLLAENEDIKPRQRQKSQLIKSADKEILLCRYEPPLRLIILGAVHIAIHLAPMAVACGYDVHIIDPRAAWLRREAIAALPDSITHHEEWSDTALQKLKPDSRTAFVALTHDPKLDDPAFVYLFSQAESPCFYVGALGSRKTHDKRCERLKQAGIDEKHIASIHAPIGLNIGADNPAEIAVSIIAQITEKLHRDF